MNNMTSSNSNNIYLYFKEEGHKYTDSDGNGYTSVTTLIHDNYIPKFNKKYWLHKKAKELGISEKTLEKQWQDITDEACARGTATHNRLEDGIKDVSMFKEAIKYLTNISDGRVITVADIPNLNVKPLDVEKFKEATNNKYPAIYDVFKFYIDRGYIIYSEIGVFLPKYLISGTIDILCVRPTDFVILDWKTNRKGLQFESGYFKKDKTTKPAQLTNQWIRKSEFMLPPLNHLPNCNGYHYSMQLSLYAIMTEIILNIPCVGLGLCHIASPFILNDYGMPYRDKNNQYPIDVNGEEKVQWYRINYLRKESQIVLDDRLIEINNKNKQNNNIQKTLFDDENYTI